MCYPWPTPLTKKQVHAGFFTCEREIWLQWITRYPQTAFKRARKWRGRTRQWEFDSVEQPTYELREDLVWDFYLEAKMFASPSKRTVLFRGQNRVRGFVEIWKEFLGKKGSVLQGTWRRFCVTLCEGGRKTLKKGQTMEHVPAGVLFKHHANHQRATATEKKHPKFHKEVRNLSLGPHHRPNSSALEGK